MEGKPSKEGRGAEPGGERCWARRGGMLDQERRRAESGVRRAEPGEDPSEDGRRAWMEGEPSQEGRDAGPGGEGS